MSKRQNGFTILELIITITILVVLAGILIPAVKRVLDDAKVARLISLIETLKRASQKYYQDTGLLPMEDDDNSTTHDLWVNNVGATWRGPYIDRPLSEKDRMWEAIVIPQVSMSGMTGLYGSGFTIGDRVIDETHSGCSVYLSAIPVGIGQRIDEKLDGGDGPLLGRVQYRTETPGPSLTFDVVCVYLFAIN